MNTLRYWKKCNFGYKAANQSSILFPFLIFTKGENEIQESDELKKEIADVKCIL